jgi:hypothetical protein
MIGITDMYIFGYKFKDIEQLISIIKGQFIEEFIILHIMDDLAKVLTCPQYVPDEFQDFIDTSSDFKSSKLDITKYHHLVDKVLKFDKQIEFDKLVDLIYFKTSEFTIFEYRGIYRDVAHFISVESEETAILLKLAL